MTDPLTRYAEAFNAPETYLNFASYGPPSQRAASEMGRLMALAMDGADSARELHIMDHLAAARISRLTGFPADSIQLVPSTSLGLFQVAFGVPAGDVLVSAGEFPANLYPWWRAQEAGLIHVRTMDSTSPLHHVTPSLVAKSLTSGTVAVAVSAVDFRTGYRADLEGIREVIGDRLLIVDGIQAFGVVDMPWTSADALVVGGQKWVRAGWGSGFFAVSDRALNRLTPRIGGWTGVRSPTQYDGYEHPVADGARAFSITNGSPFAAGALAAALELIETVGVAALEKRISERVDTLIEELDTVGIRIASPRQAAQRAGIVVARFEDGTASALHEHLASAGIAATLHGAERLRLSVHATTSGDALTAAVGVLARYA